MASLVGGRLTIVVSDPWELSDALSGAHLRGAIALVLRAGGGVHRESAFVALEEPLRWGSGQYEGILIQARHQDRFLESLESGKVVSCNFIGLTVDQCQRAAELIDMKWWRGGGVVGMASVRLTDG